MNSGVKVADAMTKELVTVMPNVTVAALAETMKKENLGSLLVVENDSMMGIVTERDLVNKVLAEKKDPTKILVKDIMTKEVTVVDPEQDIIGAMTLMSKKGIRRLPVVYNNHAVGVVTVKDLLKIEPELIQLILDRIDLREEESKPIRRISEREGICNICGNYAPILFEQDGVMVCAECRE